MIELCAYDIRATTGACETCGHDAFWHHVVSSGYGTEPTCLQCGSKEKGFATADHPFLGRVLKWCGHAEDDHLASVDHSSSFDAPNESVEWCAACPDLHEWQPGVRCGTCGGDALVLEHSGMRGEDLNYGDYVSCPNPDCVSGVVPVEEVKA